MDIVVKGRNVEVPEHFRQHVSEKLAPSERLDPRCYHIDVELSHEKNPRQSAKCQRVEITARSKGPVIRAEACAETFYAALDAAVLKLEGRLRRSHDRRRVHHGGKTPASVGQATATLPVGTEPVAATAGALPVAATEGAGPVALLDRTDRTDRTDRDVLADTGVSGDASAPVDDTASLVVRDKVHAAAPMTTEDALHEMELVGHDFFLYMDSSSGLPSVVYRRHGYDYGVIRLAAT